MRAEERAPPVEADQLLTEISDYCRRVGMAESTFGRRAVNDGKLVSRLRIGGRITTDTAQRVRSFIENNSDLERRNLGRLRAAPAELAPTLTASPQPRAVAEQRTSAQESFRFYDNRQKYLLFVNTCGEKWVIAQRVGMELASIHPRPPAVRLFDAGVGDGTVLARTMRAMHTRFPTMPFYIVGKELSVEDVRLVLEKMPDRLFEHPAMVLVIPHMLYSEAPWL